MCDLQIAVGILRELAVRLKIQEEVRDGRQGKSTRTRHGMATTEQHLWQRSVAASVRARRSCACVSLWASERA